ncbi:cysteine-rich CWC family protein [Rhodoflexus sp.]
MSLHEPKYCPRCKVLFECKPGDVANCQCSEVTISDKLKSLLSNAYWSDCLCKGCLNHLNNLSRQAETAPSAAKGSRPIEGVHYYKENGYWVFTELYHFQRGYCCQSGCRHCVYGFKQNQQ